MASFQTLADRLRYEPDKIKGSRFIANLAPAADAGAAQAFIEEIRSEFPDARHTCFAWRLGPDGKQVRSSDDGEPAGSAGRPMLAQLEGHEVTNIVACVTRYFGGVKLGVGGLMRAYGGATREALERAPIVRQVVTRRLTLSFPYECSSAIQAVLHSHDTDLTDASYGALVEASVVIPEDIADQVIQEIVNRTSNRATVS